MNSHLEVNSKCISCDNCRQICPEDAILVKNYNYCIDRFACTLCEGCIVVCPTDAIVHTPDRISAN